MMLKGPITHTLEQEMIRNHNQIQTAKVTVSMIKQSLLSFHSMVSDYDAYIDSINDTYKCFLRTFDVQPLESPRTMT